jgi:MoaA/NifB/PqqE/SkfB family radical SAM enzyme
MERVDSLKEMITSMATQAGVLLAANKKARSLFLKRAEHAAYEYIINENLDKRPMAVQKEKMQIVQNLAETTAKRIEEGLYSKNVISHGVNTFVQEMVFSPRGKKKEIVDNFTAKYGRRPPGFLVIGPTKRCNLHCKGCYASSHAQTAIDKKMAKRMADLGNVVPQVSVEGFEKETDARRGTGVFKKVLTAFSNMREAGVPFGIAVTPMRHNYELLTSDEFIDFYFNKQKVTLAWVFQYMPIGRGYSLELMITPEQRLRLLDREREILWKKRLFYVDFWNSGPIGSGCIAGGRPDGYLYIDWNGHVMPCPYYQFSPVNIFDVYKNGGNLNDVYNQPFFEALRKWQDEYAYKRVGDETGNWLRPCPIRDHHKIAMEAIKKYNAKPEDKATEKWLHDENLHQGLIEFDDQLAELMDPYWEKIYLKEEEIGYDKRLPFTSSAIPKLGPRFG